MSDNKKVEEKPAEEEGKQDLMPHEELDAADGSGSKLAAVESRTGEEDEELVWKARAKAYRFDEGENEWKERGVGDLRFLKSKEGKFRILMRRDQILKACIAMNMSEVGPLKDHANSDKAYVMTGMDYSEEDEATRETICIKFTNPDTAKLFAKHYKECGGPDN